jgi:hypothetical protein
VLDASCTIVQHRQTSTSVFQCGYLEDGPTIVCELYIDEPMCELYIDEPMCELYIDEPISMRMCVGNLHR